ncbi:glycosyltransferase [Propionivibrio sp.]|uniref:glycosyltransferase n=1 Tax=Propionivibrio sp. TaxID=2212460 RepID=UPI0025DFB13D|nr:glycosyltransferase [Propionivibrio sp.]
MFFYIYWSECVFFGNGGNARFSKTSTGNIRVCETVSGFAMKPLVSVIIPTFNQRPDFLLSAVNSVLKQSFEDIELVVSDNHSDNRVADVLVGIDDKRVRLVSPPTHIPMIHHFAFAADQAKGEFLSFLASDDWVYPDWLSLLLPELIANPQVSFGFGEIENVHHQSLDKVRYVYREDGMTSGVFGADVMLPIVARFDKTSGWMVGDVIRTDAYRECGGILRDNLSYCADFALAMRLMEVGDVLYVNKRVAKNRSWSPNDGKQGGSRLIDAISDMNSLYELLESNEVLMRKAHKDKAFIARAKRAKGRLLCLQLLEEVSQRKLTTGETKLAAEGIRRIWSGYEIDFLLSLTLKPMPHALMLVRPAALYFLQNPE